MLNKTYLQESFLENAEVVKQEGKYHNFFVNVYGTVVVKEFETHIRISMDDWNKFKQRLIPVLKQGDMKDGSTETGS